MCVEIPDVRVGEPVRCGALTVIHLYPGLPLFPEGDGTCDYLLAHEAMAAGVVVREVSGQGEVPFLLVENLLDRPVLFVEGELVRGGKQDRVLNTSVLIAANSQTRIPVSCTEVGRWKHKSPQFEAGSYCSPSLRHILKTGRRPDQFRMWAAIQQKHFRLGVRSPTRSLADALEEHRDRVEELRSKLPYPEGACGVAVAVNGKVVCVDTFDKPATLAKLWNRLTQGLALDALEHGDTGCQASETEFSVELYKRMRWNHVEPVIGLGQMYRATNDDGTLATALVLDDTPIHVSMSMPTMG